MWSARRWHNADDDVERKAASPDAGGFARAVRVDRKFPLPIDHQVVSAWMLLHRRAPHWGCQASRRHKKGVTIARNAFLLLHILW
jgi:hypothetical protein